MRKIIHTIICFAFCTLLVAQEESTIIKVSAHAVHNDPTPTFKAMMSVGSAYSSLPSEIITLENMKEQYKKVLKTNGINWNELKENPNEFGYETMGYEKEGIIYEYNTNSVSAMKKFLKIKSLGVQRLSSVAVLTIDSEEARQLSKIAILRARERASIIAEAMGKTLGEIQEVEDLNDRWGDKKETSLYYDQPTAEYKYFIHVTFKVN